jgi:hypothetical protein
MSDKGIKNVIIKKDLLGKVTSSNSRVVRFRLVSEDKNRKSAYSKIFITNSDVVIVGVGTGDINLIRNTIMANWSSGQISTQIVYDVFVGFDGAIPSYVGSTASQNYSFLKDGTQSVRVVIQASSINPVLTSSLEVYDSGIKTFASITA